jgi:hypothetical protein
MGYFSVQILYQKMEVGYILWVQEKQSSTKTQIKSQTPKSELMLSSGPEVSLSGTVDEENRW